MISFGEGTTFVYLYVAGGARRAYASFSWRPQKYNSNSSNHVLVGLIILNLNILQDIIIHEVLVF